MAKADTPIWPIMASAESMTSERIAWMRARVSDEEEHNPGMAWVEWLASALDRIAELEKVCAGVMTHEVGAVLRLYQDPKEWESWTCRACGGVYPRDIITACPNCVTPAYVEEAEPESSAEDEP